MSLLFLMVGGETRDKNVSDVVKGAFFCFLKRHVSRLSVTQKLRVGKFQYVGKNVV